MNHHQLPFCEAVMEEENVDFTFIQTQAMEEERKKMGWEDYGDLGFVRHLYDDPEGARALIRDSDVVLYGWALEVAADIRARAAEGKPLVCISERLYREGQWRMFSPADWLTNTEITAGSGTNRTIFSAREPMWLRTFH